MVTTGDFSGLGATVFDPFNISSGTQRVPFANNRIPMNRIDPAARALIDLLPQPTDGGETRNFVFNPAVKQRTDQFDVKIDQNLGEATASSSSTASTIQI